MTLDPLLYDVNFNSETGEMNFYDKAGGLIYSCVVEIEKEKEKPLTFEALEDGSTVSLKTVGSSYSGYQTSLDGGTTWNGYSVTDATPITLNAGEKVCFRSKTPRGNNQTNSRYVQFVMAGKISASGNCYSMLTPDFKDVTDLTRVPNASGGTFAAEYGLSRLFYNCSSLVRAPALPAKTLAEYCYRNMFYRCTSLAKAPALPATTLAASCYSGMFSGCTSLVKAPALPATTLAAYCYHFMFNGCSALAEVTCYATNPSASSYTSDWLNGVSATGDFYADPSASWETGVNGCPEGWTRHDIAELEV